MDRQEIWERIRALGGRDEFILHEMKRLGFWDVSQGVPQVSEELRQKRLALQAELNETLKKQAVYQQKKKMLRDMRRQRMAEAKAKRAETKARHNAQRAERAAAWKARQAEDILWLGQEVSAGLRNKTSNIPQLQALGLPVFDGPKALTEAMDIPMSELQFLTYQRRVSRTVHYRRFKIAKKTGGFREISAPGRRIKAAQYWILEQVLNKMALHEAAHGFVPQRSIVTNAQPHVGASVVINMDVKDFFPTITYRRVKGLFVALGYSEQLATIFALLCTETPTETTELDGQTYHVATGERRLPQGAPTSPVITNILCRGMDRRFEGMARALGWAYTRYADDLTFSKNGSDTRDVNRILWQARQIMENEGFTVHPDKVKVMRKGARQEVTGVIVNEKPNIPREKLKQFRAVLHRLETQGPEAVQFGKGQVYEVIQGFANYVLMVNPQKGGALKAKIQTIMATPAAQAYLEQKKAKNGQGTGAAQAPDSPTHHAPLEAVEWWRVF